MQGTREQGNEGTRERGNKGTREQGNEGTREQGNKGTRFWERNWGTKVLRERGIKGPKARKGALVSEARGTLPIVSNIAQSDKPLVETMSTTVQSECTLAYASVAGTGE